ncbi:MAG: hypothetical protein A2Y73_02875 [Chloroflexi bacterium RBG_13_56_8]|nr:MAG: hypothetical protein A2Y73_02875 [Chloroflexi bacterium RBG_13_56_8]
MSRVDYYREVLRNLSDWDAFLLQESGLPGPRGNLELAHAVADEGNGELFVRYLSYDPQQAPTNSPYEFLAFCGVVGMGRLLAEGRLELFETLRQCASDPRWRMREGVAQALQRLGRGDMGSLLAEMERWSKGTFLEKRAAAAALSEPELLGEGEHVLRVLRILDDITASIASGEDRRSEEFRVLRQGLGYCWSVVVAALPEEGKRIMEKWLAHEDRDVLWIMRQNLRKKRLARLDAEWVESWKAQLGV